LPALSVPLAFVCRILRRPLLLLLVVAFLLFVSWQVADGWISMRLREDDGALGDVLLEKV